MLCPCKRLLRQFNFSLWLKATSLLVWFQTNFCTWPRTWSVYQSILTFLCKLPPITLRPYSKKVRVSDPVRSGERIMAWINRSGMLRPEFTILEGFPVSHHDLCSTVCAQAPCLRWDLWQRCKNGRKEETRWWSSCPGSCGDGSGAKTKTSLKPHRWPRYQLVQTGRTWRD